MFREDVYARDAAVLSALDGQGPIRIVFRQPVPAEPEASTPPEVRKAAIPRQDLKTGSNPLPADAVTASLGKR